VERLPAESVQVQTESESIAFNDTAVDLETHRAIVSERDRLIGENNYLKKKVQSVTQETEKLQKHLSQSSPDRSVDSS
jgi:hypothetical protein